MKSDYWRSPDDYARALADAAVRGDVMMPNGEPLWRDQRVCLRWDLILAANPHLIDYAHDMWWWAKLKAWGGVVAVVLMLLLFLVIGMFSPVFAVIYLLGALVIGRCLRTWPLELSIAMCKTLHNFAAKTKDQVS